MKKTIITPETIIASRYQINHPLGEGGMGITYEAFDNHNSEKIALKVLSLQKLNDWKTLELFEREAKILSQLNHPHIPRYLDYFQENDNFYLAQQLAHGKSLAVLIKEGWQPQVGDIKHIAQQVLEILIYLQNLIPPVVHRDIKPENIILNPATAEVFLVDFGAVKDTYQNTVTGGSTVVGTYGYMAPEQFRSQAFLATDLYGLGTTLIFLLTKKHPSDLPQKNLKIEFVSEIKLERKLANWLDKMIQPVAEDRFLNAQEALDALIGEKEIDLNFKKNVSQPRNTPINLIKDPQRIIFEIPSTLTRNNYSFFLGLFSLSGDLILTGLYFLLLLTFFLITSLFTQVLFVKLILLLIFAVGILILGKKRRNTRSYFNQVFYFSSILATKIEINILEKSIKLTYQINLPIFSQFNLHKITIIDSFSLWRDKIYLSSVKLPGRQNPFTFCVLEVNDKKYRFGLFLTLEENQWLVSEISQVSASQ